MSLPHLNLRFLVPITACLGLALASCGGPVEEAVDDGDVDPVVDGDLWQEGDAEAPPAPGKADAVLGQRSVKTSFDASATAVWSVTRQWSQRVNVDYPPYFRAADGLTWSEAYRAWIDRLEATNSTGGYRTVQLTTPFGKTLPMAALECAEVAEVLRISFAAWFGLPFFYEAIDGKRVRMFAGHFGFRTLTTKYSNFPDFKTAYRDHSSTATASNWPTDARLRQRKLGNDDVQPSMPAGSQTIGAWLDEVHANKRVGHFIAFTLLWFGSVNLADSANTFHVKPEAARPGDIVLERWQRAGIGHALVVKEVEARPNGQLRMEVASGSMPRRQPVWEGPVTSRRYLLGTYAGGPGTNTEGVPYAKLGGGLRRWRVAVVHNGAWTNIVPQESAAAWIDADDTAAIAARPEAFEQLLEIPDAQTRRTELLAALDANRLRQRTFPASCSSREKREALLRDIADLELEDRGWSFERTEREYRAFQDYVFPTLTYDRSRTCCWNSTTADMARIILDHANDEQNRAQQCRPPTPFASQHYATFQTFAQRTGRAAQWKAWSEDEPCPQRTRTECAIDTTRPMTAFCSIAEDLEE